jgi:quinol monooxygenase YgiN
MTRITLASLLTLALAGTGGCADDDDDDDAAGDGTEDDAADDAVDDAVDDAADDEAADDAAETTDDGAGTTDDGAGDESSTGVDIDALYDCVDPMPIEARPLVGPGYDPEMGGLIDPQETYIVSSTMIYVRPEKQADFFEEVGKVTAELDQSEGMVAYSLALDTECGFSRTLSIYRSQEEMTAFAGSAPHAHAVVRANELGVTGKVTHWELSGAEFPPTWDMAKEKLAEIDPFGNY